MPDLSNTGAVPRASAWADAKAQNLGAIRRDIAEGRARLSGLPPIISLYSSEYCNLSCIMCERSVTPGRRKLSSEALERLAHELFPTAYRILAGGFLGEPMFADFDLTIDLCRRYDVKMDLVTNGSILTGARFAEIKDVLNRINISMDSHIPDVYEKIRAGGRWDILAKNIAEIAAERRAHRDDAYLTFSAIAMRSNAHTLPDFIRFAKENGADGVEIQVLRHYARPAAGEELQRHDGDRIVTDRWGGRPPIFFDLPPTGEMLRLYDSLCGAAYRHRINVAFGDSGAPPIIFDDRGPALRELDSILDVCWNVGLNFSVFPNGDVYPCCHPTDHLFGNVHASTCAEIWNSPTALALRAAHLAKRGCAFCTGCVNAPYLDGGIRPIGKLESLTRLLARDLKSFIGKQTRRLSGTAPPGAVQNLDRSPPHAPPS